MAQPFVQQTNSFTAPPDWQAQQADIQRRMALAQQLTSQGLDTSGEGTQMAGQVAIPNSWTQGLAKALRTGVGLYQQQKLGQEQRDLYQQQQGVYAKAGGDLMTALTPRAAQPAQEGIYDEVGGINQPATPAQPAYTPGMNDLSSGVMKYLMATGHTDMAPQFAIQDAQRRMMMSQLLQPDSGGGGAPAAPSDPGAFPTQDAASGAGQLGAPTAGPTPAAPTASTASSGTIGGIPQALAARLMAADPTGKTLAEAQAGLFKQQQAPINVRQGGTVFMPGKGPIFSAPVNGVQTDYTSGGPVASPVPGYIPATSAVTQANAGATAAGKAPYEFQNVTTAGGAQIPMSIAQLAAGAGPQAGMQPPSAPAPVPMAPRAMPNSALPTNASGAITGIPANEVGKAQAAGIQVNPGGQPMPAANDPWASMPKRVVPQGVGQNTYSKIMDEGSAKAAGELSQKYGDLSTTAGQRIATNNQALASLNNADTGALGPMIADMKNLLISAAPGLANSDWNPADSQVLYKDLTNAALQKGKSQFGARFTQGEVGIMLSKAAPSPQMAKLAIQTLLNTDNAQQGYALQQGNDLGRYLQNGGDPMRFESWYASAFPQTNVVSKVPLPTAAGALPPGIPAGSSRIGATPDGRPVYKAPDGKQYVP